MKASGPILYASRSSLSIKLAVPRRFVLRCLHVLIDLDQPCRTTSTRSNPELW